MTRLDRWEAAILQSMSFWDTVRGWFKSEVESAKELAGDLETDWSADLDRKEAELNATPEQRMEQLQDQIAANDSAFDDIRAKIDSTEMSAEIRADLDGPDELLSDAAEEDFIEGDVAVAEIEAGESPDDD